jgi:hypothetical protein
LPNKSPNYDGNGVTSSRPELPAGNPRQRGLVYDCCIAAVIIILGLILYQPGVFSVDESHYLLAANAMARDGSFHIANGYEQFRAEQLLFFYTVVPDRVDQLGSVSSVPPFHAFVATPFLLIGGLAGLIWLNILAFAGTAIAVRRMAAFLQPQGLFAPAAALAMVLGTFGLEYAFGIWPHALSQCLIAWTSLLLLTTYKSEMKRAVILAGLAGLLGGLAVGIRLQNIVLLPVFLIAARLALKAGWPVLIAHFSGWLPGLLGMCLINASRLGTYNPFTYGWSGSWTKTPYGQALGWIVSYPWILAVGLAGLTAVVWLWRKRKFIIIVAATALTILAIVILVPAVRTLIERWIAMAAYHLLDTTFLPASTRSVGSNPSELGQALYGGVLKKGLFEVAPFLILACLAIFAKWRSMKLPGGLTFLAGLGLSGLMLLPVVLSAGGLCFNPRYLLELTPLLAIVAVYFFFHLKPSRPAVLLGSLAGVLMALPLSLHPGSVAKPSGGWYPLLVPLAAALLLAVTAGLALFLKKLKEGWLSQGAAALFAATFCYACLVQLTVDLKTSLDVRYYAGRILDESSQVIPDQSVLLAWESRKDVMAPLKLDRDVIIGGLGRFDTAPVGFLSAAIQTRRIFVMQNGIPRKVYQQLAGPFDQKSYEAQGLVFVELQPKGAGHE